MGGVGIGGNSAGTGGSPTIDEPSRFRYAFTARVEAGWP